LRPWKPPRQSDLMRKSSRSFQIAWSGISRRSCFGRWDDAFLSIEELVAIIYLMDMDNSKSSSDWKYLAPKAGSAYKQLFIKGTRIMARVLYGMYMSDELPRTPEEIAAAYDLPLEAVQEAIAYCQSDPPEIRQDWEREEAHIRSRIMSDPNYRFPGIEKIRAQITTEQESGPPPSR
jgi:uncharacterized protein (DUF433 family)